MARHTSTKCGGPLAGEGNATNRKKNASNSANMNRKGLSPIPDSDPTVPSPERQELLRKIRVVEKHEREWMNHYKKALALFLKLGPSRGKAYQDEDDSLERWTARQGLIWHQLSDYQQDRLRAIGLEKNVVMLGAIRKVKNSLKKTAVFNPESLPSSDRLT